MRYVTKQEFTGARRGGKEGIRRIYSGQWIERVSLEGEQTNIPADPTAFRKVVVVILRDQRHGIHGGFL